MTFLDRKTTREAQQVRRSSKDGKGRPNGRYATPDRPGTNLSYSVTGSGNGAQSDMAAAFAAVDLPDDLKPPKGRSKARKRPQGARKPSRGRGHTASRVVVDETRPATPAALAAMRRMASGK